MCVQQKYEMCVQQIIRQKAGVTQRSRAIPGAIFTALDRINRGVSDGSLPTLLRLHRFLSPFLASPSRPFLLDDLLTVHRWRIVLPAHT
jgi:hypothetical protein